MPELPEVETVVRELRAVLPGRRIVRATLTAKDLYRKGSAPVHTLAGGRIAAVDRRGKAIVIALDGARATRLVVHLGMTGRLEWRDGSSRTRSPRPLHLHARWRFADGSELRYVDPRRFGYIFAGTDATARDTLRIGPDPFEMGAADLARALTGRRAPVKALLLDQRLISGLGNIYVDEALHLARVHPLVSGGRAAARAPGILEAARRVLTRAIEARGTTFRDYRRTDGAMGEFQLKLAVYGREGAACPRCAAAVRRIEVAQRGTHFCPRCQRAPRARPSTSRTSRAGRSRRAAPRRAGYTRSR